MPAWAGKRGVFFEMPSLERRGSGLRKTGDSCLAPGLDAPQTPEKHPRHRRAVSIERSLAGIAGRPHVSAAVAGF
jgi:hypothetical protein